MRRFINRYDMNTTKKVILLAAALLSAGCAASRGEKQADTPPRLVEQNNAVAWDRGDAFGPVPLRLAALAAVTCAALDSVDVYWQPEGFHARAQDRNGATFPGGGYYCKPKARAR